MKKGLILLALSVALARAEEPKKEVKAKWDLPAWKSVVEQVSGLADRDYYKMQKEETDRKALRAARGAVLGLIETSEFSDPDSELTIDDRLEGYQDRFEDLGSPNEPTLRLLQQLTLENLAAELQVARRLGEKRHFVNKAFLEAFDDEKAREQAEKRFSSDEAQELKHRCQNVAKLLLFLELLPGGDDYLQGLERSNAALLLYYTVHGQRIGKDHWDHPTINKGDEFCSAWLKDWPRLRTQYGSRFDPASPDTWNFQLPDFVNKFEDASYTEKFEDHEVFFIKWRTRNKGWGDETDRYKAETKCGVVELEGARTKRDRETDWTYPFYDPHYRWVGPIKEECRSPAGGVNYNNVHDVINAWSARVNGR